jgi:exopolysaccharide biosynthesis protein
MVMKKIAAFSVSLMLLFTSTALASDIYTVYDLSKETRLSSGITYENIEKFTTQGWMNINVVRANLNDQYTKVSPVTSEKGVSNRTALSSMLKSSGAVAGVNGDFFYMGDPTYTYGALIKDGKVITSPLPYSYGYPTISRLLDSTVNISLWNPKITLYGTDSTAFDVVVYNKTSSIDYGPTILTSDWNTMSIGYNGSKDIVEVVVVNNYVSEVRVNQPSTIIPKDGFIIASTSETTRQKLINSFVPGNQMSLDIQLDFDLDNIEWAVGGLNYLLKNGQTNDISDEVLGTHPRTCIGFNKDNTEIILVTIDGRNSNYVGVKQTELAQIMVSLGAYNAINMDGGGSTTMGVDFLRNSNVTVVNIPSDGTERKIACGIGIFNTAPESDDVSSIKIAPSDSKVFNNTELQLDVLGYNNYFAQVDFDKEDIKYEISPANAGTISNNVFFPKKSGKASITAYYNDNTANVEIDVLDIPVALTFKTDKLILEYGETYELEDIVGINDDGKTAIIPSNYINYSYRNKIGKVENGVFTAGKISNTGAITATFGNAVKNIQVKVGYKMKTLNRFEDLENLKLSLYPEGSSGSFEITEDYVKEGSNAIKLNYDFTKMTDQSIAFINFGENGEGIKLQDTPLGIGMWVYGDGSNHWLRCRITDAYGTQSKLTFEDEVNWTGWKWVTAKIPNGTTYPITLDNIYIAEINETKKDTGTIYVDNLRLMYEPNDKDLNLKEETEFKDPLEVSKVTNYTEKLTISPTKSQIVSSNGTVINNNGNIIYFDGIVTNGTMSASNTTMWNNIKSMANFKDKVLVLSMNSSFDTIKDQREVEVLYDILEKASNNNKIYVVWNGSDAQTTIEDGIRYIIYDDIFELGFTNDVCTYKN